MGEAKQLQLRLAAFVTSFSFQFAREIQSGALVQLWCPCEQDGQRFLTTEVRKIGHLVCRSCFGRQAYGAIHHAHWACVSRQSSKLACSSSMLHPPCRLTASYM